MQDWPFSCVAEEGICEILFGNMRAKLVKSNRRPLIPISSPVSSSKIVVQSKGFMGIGFRRFHRDQQVGKVESVRSAICR